MSHTYSPGYIADQDLREELARLQRALNDPQSSFQWKVLHAEPSRTRPGMSVYADGTDWDPGSGEGVYVRDAANAAWKFLG